MVVAESRADKVKHKLEVNPTEAEIVKMIFRLYLHGEGKGALGVKAIVIHLNDKGLRNSRGNRFSANMVYGILTRSTYSGRHYFNRFDRYRKPKPPEEWIENSVPAIVDEETFHAVQEKLKERNPKKTPPGSYQGRPC